ncbi:MAG: hypothetical protein KY475_27435, partial [Planctomycetes bacterium]|nr:hypothetical protein [Planctomycetota bacterium]
MHGNRPLLPTSILPFLLLVSPVAAQPALLTLEQLPSAIEQAKEEFAGIEPGEVERRRQELLAEMEQMERFLAPADDATEAGWKQYLLWDEL